MFLDGDDELNHKLVKPINQLYSNWYEMGYRVCLVVRGLQLGESTGTRCCTFWQTIFDLEGVWMKMGCITPINGYGIGIECEPPTNSR